MIQQAKKLKVEFIGVSENLGRQYQVGKYVVRIFKKPGRTLMICTCPNGTRFCNEPSICKHKLAAIREWLK